MKTNKKRLEEKQAAHVGGLGTKKKRYKGLQKDLQVKKNSVFPERP